LHVNVLRRWRRLVITLTVVVVIFGAWDVAAIAVGHWRYDPAQTLAVRLPGHLPLEELLFFVVIPFASILGFEAVRAVLGAATPAGDEARTSELVGDAAEASGADPADDQVVRSGWRRRS
jgi:lycopene cyclase domain-containing protein